MHTGICGRCAIGSDHDELPRPQSELESGCELGEGGRGREVEADDLQHTQ